MARLQNRVSARDRSDETHVSPNPSARSPDHGRLRPRKVVQYNALQPEDESVAYQPERRSARLASHPPTKDAASIDAVSLPTLLGTDPLSYQAQTEVSQLRRLNSSFTNELIGLVKASQLFLSTIEVKRDFEQRRRDISSQTILVDQAQKLNEMTDLFKSPEESFIHPEAVVRAIFNVKVGEKVGWGPWRPDPLLCFANSVSLVCKIHTAKISEPTTASLLQFVDHSFLGLFQGMPSYTDDDAAVDTFDIALDVRTQFLISCLYSHRASKLYDQSAIFKGVFQRSNGNAVRGWAESEQNHDETFWVQEGNKEGLKRKLENRMDRISQVLASRKTEKAKLLELGTYFSWADFCSNIVTWVRSSAKEIEEYGNQYGGLESLCQALDKEVVQRASQSKAHKRKGKSLPLLQELRKISLRVGSPNSTSTKSGGSNQQKTTKTFAEAQSNATKIAPISQNDDNDEESTGPIRRTNDTTSSDHISSVLVTQDDGFEDQAQSSESLANRRRQAQSERLSALQTKKRQLASETKGVQKRRHLQTSRNDDNNEAQTSEVEDDDNESGSSFDEAASEVSSAAARDAGTSTVHERTARNHSSIKDMAQERQRHYRVKQKKVQTRTAWTVEEIAALLALIAEHGTKWAFIKAQDQGKEGQGPEKLSNRSAEHMRDKARNLKFDYLRAKAKLPKNFDGVLLKAAQIDLLHEMGIDYTQGRHRRLS